MHSQGMAIPAFWSSETWSDFSDAFHRGVQISAVGSLFQETTFIQGVTQDSEKLAVRTAIGAAAIASFFTASDLVALSVRQGNLPNIKDVFRAAVNSFSESLIFNGGADLVARAIEVKRGWPPSVTPVVANGIKVLVNGLRAFLLERLK